MELPPILPASGLTVFRALRHVPYQFCAMMTKVNKAGRRQQRLIVVANGYLFSCLAAEGDVQRCLSLSLVTAVQHWTSAHSFALFVPSEYDMYLEFATAAVAAEFISVMPKNVPISDVDVINTTQLKLEKPAGYVRPPPATMATVFARLDSDRSVATSSVGRGQPRRSSRHHAADDQSGGHNNVVSRELAADDNRGAAGNAIPFPRLDAPTDEVGAGHRRWAVIESEEPGTLTTSDSMSTALDDDIAALRRGARSSAASGFAGSPSGSKLLATDDFDEPPVEDAGLPGRGRGLSGSPRRQQPDELRPAQELVAAMKRAELYRTLWTETLAAERERAAALRSVIDELRAEVQRLSMANLKLRKHLEL